MAGQQTVHYNIGQIIYILSNKSQSVVPAIVAEEDFRTVKKLDGVHEVVNYKLCIGPKDRQKMVELSRIDGEVYTSLEDIRVHMIKQLTDFVDNLVAVTQTNVQNWYGVVANNQILDATDTNGAKFDPEQIIDAVNKNVPLQQTGHTHPLQLPNVAQQQNPHLSLRDNIRNMVAPEDDDPMQGLGLNSSPQTQGGYQQHAILPDGTRVPIRQ